VLEQPADLDLLHFNWRKISFDMSNDGLTGTPSETALNEHMEWLGSRLPHLTSLALTLFPSPLAFLTLQGLTTTPSGRHLAARLTELRMQACHPSHLASAMQLLEHATNLTSLALEHLQLEPGHHHVVNLDTRRLLSWLPPSLAKLKVRGFHLLRSGGAEEVEGGGGPTYPGIKSLEFVFCGASDPHLLHVACLCPNLESLTVVVSMTGGQGGAPQPPQQGMIASHLHSLCHNPSLVECIVLVKVSASCGLGAGTDRQDMQVGEGWIQVDDRDMLGELVLGSSSETLRKVRPTNITFITICRLSSSRFGAFVAMACGAWCALPRRKTSV
jgi:hypothetical protein